MKNAKQFWLESKEIKFPLVFDNEDYNYTITDMDLFCPNCNRKAVQLRGEVKENFGCIEIRMSGICDPCKLVTDNRSRIYPKQHRFLTLKNGVWMEGDMKPNIFYRMLDYIKDFFKQ